jgi:hypothetical protein
VLPDVRFFKLTPGFVVEATMKIYPKFDEPLSVEVVLKVLTGVALAVPKPILRFEST